MTIETYIVDAFTDQPFKGNPAGVCIVQSSLSNDLMLKIAQELGLSETAFILQNSPQEYDIRYFSPVMEIPLCGHATLASSKVLFSKYPALSHIHFKTVQQVGLHITKEEELISMEFPIYDTSPAKAPEALLVALGIDAVVNSVYNAETKILLLEIEDCDILRNLEPDYSKLISSHDSINGVLVTAKSDEELYDFESRYFWPWSGTNEDPATGGTHTFLAKYWGERLHKSNMKSFQCSQRSGWMHLQLLDEKKMLIISQANIVFKGELMV